MKRYLLTYLIMLPMTVMLGQHTLIIHVFEKTEQVCLKKTSIDSTLLYPDIAFDKDSTYTKYVIDMNELSSSYYVDNQWVSTLPVDVSLLSDGVMKVQILEQGFDYGLLVRTDSSHESVTWFWLLEDETRVKKITRFVIEKAS